MKTLSALLSVLALALTATLPASACPTCARHNPTGSTGNTDDHGHEHLDEDEGFMMILGEGHTDGWTFDDEWFSIEEGVLVAGTMEQQIPRSLYAHYETEYYNFELRLQVKLEGPRNGNGGIQFRSEVREQQNDMRGYQADMGAVYWGRIYDQSRGRGLLTAHPDGFSIEEDINHGDWNDYVIRCEDNHIQVWINGTLTADYTEENEEIAGQAGLIGLQLHSGPPSIRYYRHIRIKELD